MADVNRTIATGGAASPGNVVAVLRESGPLTRQQLQVLLGLSRATLVERLDTLTRLRMVRTAGLDASSVAEASAAVLSPEDGDRLGTLLGLLSDAMESLVNRAGAAFGLLMVKIARRPADAGHA